MNSILNVLLTAGVISIIADAIITSVRAAAARKRELKGLLRMLYVEIEGNKNCPHYHQYDWSKTLGSCPKPDELPRNFFHALR